MPTFIKTGFWDKLISNNPQQAKAPKGWLNLDNFVQTIAPPSTSIYTSNGTLTGNRTLLGANNTLNFADLNVFKTSVGGGDTGLKLDFSNNYFQFGQLTGGNQCNIEIYDNFRLIRTMFNGTPNGISFDHIGKVYYFGNWWDFNKTHFVLQDNIEKIIFKSDSDEGLILDFATKIYEFGSLSSAGNGTRIRIDDAAAFPVQIGGANVTQNTSGATSGKFLKIKVGGVDYVIELKNPS